MEGSEEQEEVSQDPGLSEAPTGAPVPETDEQVNESHPNEGEIEEASESADLDDSPEGDSDEESSGDQL